MQPKDRCFIAEFEFGKLTKSNSVVINNRLVYISKKDYTGKTIKVYIAFDYETKIQLGFFSSKEKAIEILSKYDWNNINDI